MTALHEIREQLAAIKGLGGFATRRTHSAGDLYLDVQGVGPIRLPVSQATARRLAASARPARYGLKDQTLYDSRVRDTGEIPKARIRLDRISWNRTLQPMLERLRRDLGLADGVRLTAAMHKMLVYGPGQFFASHQDSEKTDDMLGTLLVILPSRYSGGALLLEHHDERLTYRGSSRQLTFIAFYADCHHEVRPVTSGHRIVLTYTLAAKGEGRGTDGTVPEDQMHRLTRSVQAHFETARPPRWSSDTRRERPDRLVYLLDHQYTPRGLGWTRLKNTDAARAGALREVARRLGCDIALALADVHESWSCEDEGRFTGRYARDRWPREGA